MPGMGDELAFWEGLNIAPNIREYTRMHPAALSEFSMGAIKTCHRHRHERARGWPKALSTRLPRAALGVPEKSILSIEILNCTFTYLKRY
jgi:hypothetical protein